MSSAADVPVRETRRRRLAEEWALVLLSDGLSPTLHRSGRGFALTVRGEEYERAAQVLDEYERERLLPVDSGARANLDLRSGLVVAAGLLALFALTGHGDPTTAWFVRGSADAARILDGETWRAVTALTLHADLRHVSSNAVAGGLLTSIVCGLLGSGLGCLLVLASGAGGNLLNAWLYANLGHVSVGASTSVFGAVGLLAGLAVDRRLRLGLRGRRAWLPAAAGLAVLAMLGTGGAGTDVWAHLHGLVVGGVLGLATALGPPRPPGRALQWGLGACAALAIVVCWALALGSA